MTPHRSIPSVVAIFASLAACGGGVELDSFSAEYSQVICNKFWECCSDPELMEINGLLLGGAAGSMPNAAICASSWKNIIDRELVTPARTSREAGRLVYDSGGAANCISDIAAMSCAQFTGSGADLVAPSCDATLQGSVADGSPCSFSPECQSTYCEGASNPAGGVCKQIPAAGQACPSLRCATGSYCASSGTCAAMKADGVACQSHDECLSGSCIATSGSAGTCGVPQFCDGR